MYDQLGVHDLRQLFNNSLLLYKGRPTKIRAISDDRGFKMFDLTTQKGHINKNPYADLQAPILRIGMVNIGGSVLYIQRKPMRQYTIGLCMENIKCDTLRVNYPELGAEGTLRKACLLEDTSISDAMLGKYPSFKECLEHTKEFGGAMAFDHQFAIDAERKIFYKTQTVGNLPAKCSTVERIELGKNFSYLKILLEREYETNLPTLGSWFSLT